MPDQTDRSIRDSRKVFFTAAGLAVLAAAGVLVYLFIPKTPEQPHTQIEPAGHQLIQPAFRNEPLTVMLYYPLNGMLTQASAPAKRQPDLQAQAREALNAVFQDQRAAQAPVIRDVKLRAFYLDSQGTAYIDLTPAQDDAVRASAWDEQLALYAMVNTLMQNFEDIKAVAFLVGGRNTQTLAGHLDLSRNYSKRMDLVRQ